MGKQGAGLTHVVVHMVSYLYVIMIANGCKIIIIVIVLKWGTQDRQSEYYNSVRILVH